jgi:hypothetical protein
MEVELVNDGPVTLWIDTRDEQARGCEETPTKEKETPR